MDYMHNPKELTVGELIEQLQKLPHHWPVEHEGCDCTGNCGPVEMQQGVAYLTRVN